MARKKITKRREIIGDPKYNSKLVSRFINIILKQGKKSIASRICYNAFSSIKEKTKEEPLTVFNHALENCKPLLELKSRRVGGATYQVPIEVDSSRGLALAMRWIISGAETRPEKTMEERVAAEILDAFNKRGSAMKKREDTHKMAEANKAFAHFRW